MVKPKKSKYKVSIGQIFGQWTIKSIDEPNPRFSYICECSCGTTRSIRLDHLILGKSKSCGCQLIKHEIKIGDNFNFWTVLEKVSGQHDRSFLCRCVCGTTKLVGASSLVTGESKSCGCYRNRYRKKNNYSPAFNYLVSSYKKGARKRGLKWDLSDEECLFIFKSTCHYCGVPPYKQVSYKNNKPQLPDWEFVYNGIDRVDSNLGYLITNVVASCEYCNYAKRDWSEAEFSNWINRLVTFQSKKKLVNND